MASIKDVAAAAGVSTATVSRVLSDHPHVRPDVRERVLATVARLAYRPNLVARNLRSQQSNTLGLIVSDIRNPFFTALSRAVEDTASAHGFNVVLCNTDENPTKEAMYLNVMRDEHAAGIILSPTHQALAHFSDLHINQPLVLVDRAIKNGAADAVVLDNIAAAYELTTHLLQGRYRRIGALFSHAITTGPERQRGYEQALREHDLQPQPDLVKHVEPRIETGCAAARELLALPDPPDALLASNSLLTAGALQAIRERALAIPNDVALAGFDDTVWAELVQPAITVMAQPTDEIGRTATELLLQRIAQPARPTRTIILQGRLHVRDSSRGRTA